MRDRSTGLDRGPHGHGSRCRGGVGDTGFSGSAVGVRDQPATARRVYNRADYASHTPSTTGPPCNNNINKLSITVWRLERSSDKIINCFEPETPPGSRRKWQASASRPGGRGGGARAHRTVTPAAMAHGFRRGGASATYACVSGRRVHLHSRACSLSGREHSDSALATISHLPVFALAGDRGRSAALQDPCT